MIQSRSICTFDDLAALTDDWLKLWEECDVTPFQHPAFVLNWWQSFHPGQIEATAFFRDDHLVALAPLYREEQTHRLLIMGMGLGDYLDVISRTDQDAQNAVIHWLASVEPPVSLEDLPPSSLLRSSAVTHCICPIDGLDRPLLARMRRGLALSRNRIKRRGAWSFMVSAPPISHDLLAAFARLHRERQTIRGRSSLFDDPRAVSFISKLTADRGFPIRLYEGRIDGDIAALAMVLYRGSALYLWLLAMSEAYAFESPAKCLLGDLREAAIMAGITRFYWLRGDEAYKADWGAEPAWSYIWSKGESDLQASA